MEAHSNKTIICSVLFLDIVEYSKKPVTGQISLKDRFNTYLSAAIHDVPVTDRIILDTGDGAAVNFLGDVEAALTAALRLRASLLSEDPYLEPQLLVRIGINLGPVRLVRDINGQPNIVGDGINVAQRVMGFAEASQILVSRSYYDAVSRLSTQYAGMFHYQGSRTDKHVREHEVYAIGYPGDQTTKRMSPHDEDEKLPNRIAEILGRAKSIMFTVAAKPSESPEKNDLPGNKRRLLYAGMVVMPLLLFAAVLALIPGKPEVSKSIPAAETMQSERLASAVPAVSAVASVVDKLPQKPAATLKIEPVKPSIDKAALQADAQAKHKAELAAKKPVASAKISGQAQSKSSGSSDKKATPETEDAAPEASKEAYIAVSCKDDVQLFLDGMPKGKLISGAITLTTKPGKHKIILTHASFGIFTEEVSIEPGKTVRVKPKICN
jgi:hypothetical protein